MKILLLNCVFGIGSTGKILFDLKQQYSKIGHEVYVLYGRHSSITNDRRVIKCAYEFESKICHFISLFTGNIYGNMLLSTNKLIKLIKKIKPDVVHLHCLNGYFVNIYKLIKFLKKHNINTVLTNHAEFMYTANCGYSIECNKWINDECRKCQNVENFNGKLSLNRTHKFYVKMKGAFDNFETLKVTNVSPWLTERSKKSTFFKNRKNITVLNPVSYIDSSSIKNPYEKYNIGKDEKIILFVTASYNNNLKGGFLIPKIAKLFENQNYHFFVKSSSPVKNAHDSKNLTFINDNVDSTNLASLYRNADVTLLLSLRETFSMIVAESLMQGTPVVGFLAGGPESICIPEYCSFTKYNDLSCLEKNIKDMINKSINKNTISYEAKKKYSLESICNDYIKIYEQNN